jgi:hypothetical protein
MATTKKAFKEQCDLAHVYGRGADRWNTIYFEWRVKDSGRGFRLAVAARASACTKAELFKHFYDWQTYDTQLPYYVLTRTAKTDEDRFRVPLSFQGFN